MKKISIALFLVALLCLPLFATDKGKTELNVKLGLNLNPTATASIDGILSSLNNTHYSGILSSLPSMDGGIVAGGNMQYTAGIEGYYYVINNLGVGLGVTRAFPTGYVNELIARADSVNMYATVKQEIEISEKKIIDNMYLFGRIGYAINNLKSDVVSIVDAIDDDMTIDVSMDNGLYWALGIGVEKSNFLVELFYSLNYSKINVDAKDKYGDDVFKASTDLSLSTIGINVGYRFLL